MSDHLLLMPEGNPAGRRHAHDACVLRARAAGELRSRDEWRRSEPAAPARWHGLLGRLRGRRSR